LRSARGKAAFQQYVEKVFGWDEDVQRQLHNARFGAQEFLIGFAGVVLLTHLGTRRLILTGLSSHQCVLFTANDAHVRNFALVVPRDCIGAGAAADTRFALRYFESVLGADTRASTLQRMSALQPRLS
jgi:hypothetical protein